MRALTVIVERLAVHNTIPILVGSNALVARGVPGIEADDIDLVVNRAAESEVVALVHEEWQELPEASSSRVMLDETLADGSRHLSHRLGTVQVDFLVTVDSNKWSCLLRDSSGFAVGNVSVMVAATHAIVALKLLALRTRDFNHLLAVLQRSAVSLDAVRGALVELGGEDRVGDLDLICLASGVLASQSREPS